MTPRSIGLTLLGIAALAHAAPQGELDPEVIEGREGWLFYAGELRFLEAGQFWGDRTATVSRASRAVDADPLPAILDFHRQLNGAGIELVVVPIPCKATIYADKRTDGLDEPGPRNDTALEAFIALLEKHEVRTIDLAPILMSARDGGEAQRPLYCRTDTHLSPTGLQIVAGAIDQRLRDDGLWSAPPVTEPLRDVAFDIVGDLVRMQQAEGPAERLIGRSYDGAESAIDRASPVVLLGDSHCLVFSVGGDMYTRGAGLPEHLARAMNQRIDVVGVRGSGATSARVNLMRRGKRALASKKLLIWVFAARDLTESRGWKLVPVVRGPSTPPS